jgi:glycosyltransferase involved in cell wall biosynthesis
MRRLLLATDSFLPRWDGVARFLSEVIPFLTDKFSITVIAPHFGTTPVMKKVRIITVPIHSFQINDYKPPHFATQIIAEEVRKADLVWTQTIGPIGGTAILQAKKLGVKLVSYVHSVEWELVPRSLPRSQVLRISSRIVTRSLARNLYNKSDLLMVPSSEIGDVLEVNDIRTKKSIVPMGVDSRKFSPPRHKSEAKHKIGIDPQLFVIGFCGRIAREKDLPTLHNAFLRVSKKYPNTMLLIVGGGLSRVQRLFSGRKAFSVGPTDNVIPYLQAMDIFVLPSLTETSSLATMEAMACGVPVIVTPVGHLRNYVKPFYNGLIFAPHDVEALEINIETLLIDRSNREAMGRNARQTILKSYRWDRTVKKVRETLSKM